MTDLTINQAGISPKNPVDIRKDLIASIKEKSPEFTAELPGTLIEDILSTSIGCLLFIDQAKSDLINSISASTANEALLDQIGSVYGISRKQKTNANAYVVFRGTSGFVIPKGLIVSDGVHRFYVQEADVVNSLGNSELVYVVSDDDSIFDIPANTITKIESSIRSDLTLTVSNPQDGNPGQEIEDEASYRERLMDAGQVASIGTIQMIKTRILSINGVIPRLLSVVSTLKGYSVIVGGGDPVEVANAIFQTIPTIGILQPSIINISKIDNGNPTVIYTNLAHGLHTGDEVSFSGTDEYPSLINSKFPITYINDNSFSIPVDTSGGKNYGGGLILDQNVRNINIILQDGADSYGIPFIVPLKQKVSIQLTWYTNFDSNIYNSLISTTIIPLITQYINNIRIGEPISKYRIENIFLNEVNSIFNQNLITKIDIVVFINNVAQSNLESNKIIQGDPQSYFETSDSDISIVGNGNV